MARNFDAIKHIDGSCETLRLAIRITDLWVISSQEKSGHLEMVIMDAKGDKIQAIAKKDQFVKWHPLLVEKRTYIMNNFKPFLNEGQYKTCDHGFKLLFSGATTIKEEDLPDIPLNVYHFKDFSEILSGEYKRDVFVDIIGAIDEVTYQGIVNCKRKIVFNLKDLSGNLLNCTLWEEYAHKLIEYYNGKHVANLIVIVLTNARIKDAQGAFPVGISNSYYCSKLIINEEIEEIMNFKNQFEVAGLSQIETQSFNMSQFTSNSQFSAGSQFSEEEKFLYKAPVKTLAEINDMNEDIQCVTVATIGKINTSSNGWYYEGCNGCTKTAGKTRTNFTCSCGRYNETAKTRYRVEMEVYHNKFNTKFVFWDRECERLIGMTALELRHLTIKELGEDDPKYYPKPLDRMLGYTMVFRVKLQDHFKNCAVLRMSDDPKFIKSIMEHMANDEDTSGTKKSMDAVNLASVNEMGTCESLKSVTAANVLSQAEAETTQSGKSMNVVNLDSQNEETAQSAKSMDVVNLDSQNEGTPQSAKSIYVVHHGSQKEVLSDSLKGAMTTRLLSESDPALSVTADHDPDLFNAVTPAKRQSLEVGLDELQSQSFCPTQLSTTKLSKQIKKE